MNNKVMDEILDIAKTAGMKIEPITVEIIKPLFDVEFGTECKRCGKWFEYDTINPERRCNIAPNKDNNYWMINTDVTYCSRLCRHYLKIEKEIL